MQMLFSVKIVAHVSVVVLLFYLENNRAVRLYGLLKDLIFGAASVQAVLVVLDLLLHKLRGKVPAQVLFQQEMQGLAKTGRFYSFHFYLRFLAKIMFFLDYVNILALFISLLKGQITQKTCPVYLVKNEENLFSL